MSGQIEIYKNPDGNTQIEVRFEKESVWLSQYQLADLFETDRTAVLRHIQNIYNTGELDEKATCAKIAQVRLEGKRQVKRDILHYNLDMIISVGYRVNSKRGTQFRIWATGRLKDYLVKGYTINKKRLEQTQQEVRYLKSGLQILSKAIDEKASASKEELLGLFNEGLTLLDHYDHQKLMDKGKTIGEISYPGTDEYMSFIGEMYSGQETAVFAKPKDKGFASSVNQIKQTFDGKELYPSLEEKAANLLYLIVKNHSFVDGNKRIAAACFLYFLARNNALKNKSGVPILSNQTLATLTLFVAVSNPDEKNMVVNLIITILNEGEK